MRVPSPTAHFPALVALCSLVLGCGTVVYVGLVSGSLIRVAALPLILILMALLVVDKRRLFLLVMLFRSVGDPIFDASKLGIGGISLGVGGALNALMILMSLMFLMQRPKAKATAARPRLRMPLWVLLVLPVLVLSVFRSPEPGTAIRVFLAMLSYAAVFMIPFYLIENKSDFRLCIRVVLLSSILPVLYSFVDIALHWGGGGHEGFRLKSTFTHPNILAFYLVLVVSLLFYRFKTESEKISRPKAWVLGAYMVLCLGLLVLTKTRSAWIATFFIFGIYAVRHEKRMLIYLVTAPLLALLLPDVRDRLLDLTDTNLYDPYAQLNSFDWRVEIWKTGIAWMEPLSLLIGYGLNTFTYYSPQFFPLAGKVNFGAHNVYVQWFFETGLLGMLCFAWVFYRLLRTMARRLPEDRQGTSILMSLVAAYLIVSASDNMIDYLSFNWYFWFTIGAVCSSIGLLEKRQSADGGEMKKAPPARAMAHMVQVPYVPRRGQRVRRHPSAQPATNE